MRAFNNHLLKKENSFSLNEFEDNENRKDSSTPIAFLNNLKEEGSVSEKTAEAKKKRILRTTSLKMFDGWFFKYFEKIFTRN